MNNKKLLTIILSVLILTSCSAEKQNTQQSIQNIQTTASESDNVSCTDISETAAETEIQPTEPVDLSEYFVFDLDTSDYGERFCDWYFDDSCVLLTEQEFLHNGGTGNMLAAGEKAVRSSEDLLAADEISKTAELRGDGSFYYTVDDRTDNRFSLADKIVDENGRANVLFSSAVIDDFDGDGCTEAFMVYDIPCFDWLGYTMQCLVFVDKNGSAEYLASGYGCSLELIRYDGFAHIAACFGVNITSSYMNIYSIEKGVPQLKRTEFSLGCKQGIAISESAAQAPGSWLVVWDNIDKTYKEIASEYASEELIAAIEASPIIDGIGSSGDEYAEITNAAVYGGKYVVIVCDGYGTTYEYDNGQLIKIDSHFIDADSGSETITMNICEAEKQCRKAPAALEANVSQYTVSTDGVYDSAKDFARSAPQLLSAAEDIVYQSRYYKKLSYQFENAAKGSINTFYDYGADDTKTFDCNFDSAFFEGDKIKPIFKLGAYDDFDGDGKNEAFITFRLPYINHRLPSDRNMSEYEIEMLVYVSDSGGCVVQCDKFRSAIDMFRLIKYSDETHLLVNEKYTDIYSVRYGVPCLEMSGVVPDGNGVSFDGYVFYDTDINEYRFAKFVEADSDMLDKLNKSPVIANENDGKRAERAWIAGGTVIFIDDLKTYYWDGENFSPADNYISYYKIKTVNGMYLSRETDFLRIVKDNNVSVE